jgi:hypothetical protein
LPQVLELQQRHALQCKREAADCQTKLEAVNAEMMKVEQQLSQFDETYHSACQALDGCV